MATGGLDDDCKGHFTVWPDHLKENFSDQSDEVLALQSIFEGDQEEGRIRIFSEARMDNISGDETYTKSSLYSLELTIPVTLEVDDIQVDACLPIYEPQEDEEDHQQSLKPSSVAFRRSISGHNLIGSIHLSHLTPLTLLVILPPEYPSCGPPQLTLTCLWLSGQQLCSLCKILDKLWEDQQSMPVLYTWMDWLENNRLSYLGIRDRLMIREVEDDDIQDSRTVPECYDVADTVNILMRYNNQMELVIFGKTIHECGVCFMEYPGSSFYRMKQCKHYVCRHCMEMYCSVHVKDGTVFDLVCPETDCKTDIPPYILKEVLGDEQFLRWERLAFQKGLEKMGDIVWCPRCKNPVVKDQEHSLGHCFNCYFTFCTACSMPWHQGQKCLTMEAMLLEATDKLEKEQNDKEDTQRKLKILEDEIQSFKYVKSEALPCPKCTANIQKDGGCNNVTCTQCGCNICWLCGKNISVEKYNHFANSRCQTFTLDNDNDMPINQRPVQWRREPERQRQQIFEMQARLQLDPTTKFVKCPRCKQRNMRGLDKNNHIKCWNCNGDYCFLCTQAIHGTVTKHFQRGHCKQHTTDD